MALTHPNALTVLRNRNFRLYIAATALFALGLEIVTVALGWHVYATTRSTLNLGLIGLVQFLPSAALAILAGTTADRFPRHRIMAACVAVDLVIMLALFTALETTDAGFALILGLVALLAATRAFYWPAAAALAPTLVSREQLSAASACSSATWQLTVIVGPVFGGLLYGISLYAAQAAAMTMAVGALFLVILIQASRPERSAGRQTIASLVGGFRHVFTNRLILGAISLDLFVVFLGGAMALMPVFAQDVLVLDPWGLGLLRSGIGIGAVIMAVVLGIWPIRRYAGPLLFAAIAVFGVGTVVFGLSKVAWLSILALMVMGAADMVSVVIRDVLTQVWTPDHLRGRVNAAVMIFINASNELGDFRAGSVASLIGPVPTVLLGGAGIFVTLLIYILAFPTLRRADDLHKGPD